MNILLNFTESYAKLAASLKKMDLVTCKLWEFSQTFTFSVTSTRLNAHPNTPFYQSSTEWKNWYEPTSVVLNEDLGVNDGDDRDSSPGLGSNDIDIDRFDMPLFDKTGSQ